MQSPTTNTAKCPPMWNFWGQDVRAPSVGLTTLRAELMAKGYFSYHEKKKIPGLTLGMLQHRKAVETALGWYDDISKRMRDCGSLDQWNNPSECKVPLCPRCMMLKRGRETAENIELFAHQGNDKLVFLTLLLPLTRHLDDIPKLKAEHKLKIRNALKYQARKDPRWKQVYMKGYWEIEHYLDTELDEVGRNKKIATSMLNPYVCAVGASIWHLHCHAIVALGDISMEELKQALRAKAYDIPYQVDIEPFESHRGVEDNIKSITRYGMKFRIEKDFKRAEPFDPDYVFDMEASHKRSWWPKKAVQEFARLLCKSRASFQATNFWIGPDGKKKNEVRLKRKKILKAPTKTEVLHQDIDKELDWYMDDGISSDLSESDVHVELGVSDDGVSSGINKNTVYDTNWLHQIAEKVRERHAQSRSSPLPPDNSGSPTGPQAGPGEL
ncbi:hypothetical protein [Devosia sp.]|uniref:hypothetical protein n=1 Tax=Devosia sp. TaxID=1871048 RepID=UPI001B05405B|nr:hypothetical protein [Devosia sp.]MBO9589464.1 hypothetical protein [Devosia sp.]